MNAIKFVVLLLIAVVCDNVGAIRPLEEGSKENELGVSVPKAQTTKGVGAELTVIVYTHATSNGEGYANAKNGPKGPGGSANGSGFGSTSGYVRADGPNARAFSRSTAYGRGSADAAAGPKDATANGNGSGGGTTVAYGSTGPRP